MVNIEYSDNATLSLTPDHMLLVDGKFAAARHVIPGSILTPNASVKRVYGSTEAIISPVTVSGTVLAAGATGPPLVASVYPEWISDWMLATRVYPLPLSLSAALAYLFPLNVQRFYDVSLEPFFVETASALKAFKGAAPAPLVTLAMIVFDVGLSCAFVGQCWLTVHVVAAVAAALALKKGSAAPRKCGR